MKRYNAKRSLVGMVLTVFALFAGSASGASLLELVSPGKLSSSHAVENIECSGCHQPGNKGAQTELCLDCHDLVRSDIESKTGLHGRHPLHSMQRCNSCHTEHGGADANIRGLQESTFDHRNTDFDLSGSHDGLTCKACHEPGARRRDAGSACGECHRSPHREVEASACGDCHEDTVWSDVAFEHRTGFALNGAHDTVRCVSCHVLSELGAAKEECVGCHGLKSPHAGLFGDECTDCHGQASWSELSFDHERDAGVALEGGHAVAECHACHRYKTPVFPESTDCYACHTGDDIHTGANGIDCGSCHRPKTWSLESYDHRAASGFPLEGKHAGLSCALCHSGGIEDALETECVACHASRDAHEGAVGDRCGDCHDSSDWDSAFDHNTDTSFELAGGHAEEACQSCHKLELPQDGLPECAACHALDDVHGEVGSRDCGRCHIADSWGNTERFSHDFTDLPLLGMHAFALCESCHLDKVFSSTAEDCESCHEPVSPHGRRYGPSCATCHNPNAWSSWLFEHGEATDFFLDGRHEAIPCRACHQKNRALTNRDGECRACHRNDDVHRGRFGGDCGRCHTTQKFRDIKIESLGRSFGRF